MQDGAALTGAGTVTVTASSPHTITTTAKNGAAGSVAVGAGIAIVIASDQTTARIGADTQTLNATGAVTIGASGSFTVVSEADADCRRPGRERRGRGRPWSSMTCKTRSWPIWTAT